MRRERASEGERERESERERARERESEREIYREKRLRCKATCAEVTVLDQPLPSEFGTIQTVKARFRPWCEPVFRG